MGLTIFGIILGVLFIIACVIGVIALYIQLRGWADYEFDIQLPPKAKQQESYWEILENSVTPIYVCNECNFEIDRKYWYCPHCGKKMRNADMKGK